MNLDHEFPQGNPTAQTCRHRQQPKTIVRGALLCRGCDSPEHTEPTWAQAAPIVD